MKKPERTLFGPVVAIALTGSALLALSASLHAAEIRGTVLNKNTKRYLERAVVRIEGTDQSVLTEKDGSFRISRLPPGQYTLVSEYTDLAQASQTVSIANDSDMVNVSLEMGDELYLLDAFVVSSPKEGMAYAVNQQRRAESARTVTSVDAFIDQTTGNPGEFLKNIEGIQMVYSQNEPQAIRLRGFDPNLTMVTQDGVEIASASSTSLNRAVQVDQLSIASIESVEVFKAPIPSGPANAIGGAVNFTTKSAFNQKGRRAFAQIGVNMDSHDFTWEKSPGPGHGEEAERRVYPAARFEYSNAFLNNRLGVVFSAGYDHTNQLGSSTNHNIQIAALPGGTIPPAPTAFTMDNVLVRRGNFAAAPNRQLRVRGDTSLNLDFKVSEAVTLFLKSTYSYYHSTNRNHGWGLNPGQANGTFAPGSSLLDYAYTANNNTTPVTQSASVFDKYTETWQFVPGMKIRWDEWKVDLFGGFSKSVNHYENPDNFTSVGLGVPSVTGNLLSWRLAGPLDSSDPTLIQQLGGSDFYNLDNYISTQGNLASTAGQHRANHNGLVSNNKRDSHNVKYTGRLDIQRDFKTKYPFYLKAGAAYNENIFNKTQNQKRWYWMGEDGVATADDITTAGLRAGRFAEPVPVTMQIPGWNLREPTYFSTHELYKYWQANPQVLQENSAYSLQQYFLGRGKVNERVYAGYLMGLAKFGPLEVLPGVRVEKTELDTQGARVLPLPTGVTANSYDAIKATHTWQTTASDYTSDPFPYLHLKYELTSSLQARASYTEAIGRPNLSDIVPNGTTQNEVTKTITTNRAGLLPQRSSNYDLSVEYYIGTSGVLSGGWFRRDVKDFIATSVISMSADLLQELNLGPEYSDWSVNTKTNLGSAEWLGYELNFRQGLDKVTFLPSYLRGITFWGNYTNLYEVEGDFGVPGTKVTELNDLVTELYSAGISYRSPRGRFYIQLKTNVQEDRARANMPAQTSSSAQGAAQRSPRQEDYQFWDLDMSYKITSQLRLSATGRNIFSERARFSEMGIIRDTQQYTGVAWNFALRYDL